MADLVKEVMDLGSKINTVLGKFQEKNPECRSICNFMETLCKELVILREAPTIKDDMKMKKTMEGLKSVLVEMAKEAKKCEKDRAALKGLKADGIAQELNVRRLEMIQNILWLKGVAAETTYSLLDKIDQTSIQLNKILEAIKSLLVPIEHKVEQPVQTLHTTNSTDDASNKNKNQTKISGYSLSVFGSAIASSNKEKKVEGSSSFVHKVETARSKWAQDEVKKVYTGDVLLSNEAVAIKEFKKFDPYKEGFLKELSILSKLQHRNIVEHLGHCYKNGDILEQKDSGICAKTRKHLAFFSRYISNGSLIEVIRGDKDIEWTRNSTNSPPKISLFEIIQGIANGVRYLHSKSVVHMDLQPKDILLDKDLTPKINKFKKAVLLLKEPPFSMRSDKGTYVAPELSPDGDVWKALSSSVLGVKLKEPTKCDVYSFGIILLETMKVVWKKGGRPPSKEIREQWAMRLQKTDHLFDENVVTDNSNRALALRCVLVGMMCCLLNPARRLSMEEVVVRLGGPCTEVVPAATPSSSSAAPATRRP